MNFEYFIAGRFISGSANLIRKQPVIRLAVSSIALGVAVMLLTIMIVKGFKNQITDKVSGFAAHLQITTPESGSNYESSAISGNQGVIKKIKAIDNVKHIQSFAKKAGILKTNTEFEGIILKGIAHDFDFSFLKNHLVSGRLPRLKNDSATYDVLISKNLSDKLQLGIGKGFLIYFLENEKKVRKFNVCGIYNTGLADEFDNIYVFCDIRVIQKLNGWAKDEIGGFEIVTNDFSKADNTARQVYQIIGYKLVCKSIKDLYPQIFNWLELQNINVTIIIVLMILVASISMISALLIIILENTFSIGLLKSLGASDVSIRKIFLQISIYIIFKGLMWGNFIAIAIAFLQYKFQLVKLPPESYYVSSVPVEFSLVPVLMINAGTLLICAVMLIIPSGIISRISPARILQFE
jgi:lipoprotein-releasing system permease protein